MKQNKVFVVVTLSLSRAREHGEEQTCDCLCVYKQK